MASAYPGKSVGKIVWTTEYIGFVGFTLFALTFFASTYKPATVCLALAVVGFLSRGRSSPFPPMLKWYLVFLLWAGLGVLASMDPASSLQAWLNQWKLLIVALAGVGSLRSRGQLEVALVVVLVGIIVFPLRLATIDFFQGITLFGRLTGRFGSYANPNDLANIGLLLIGMAAWLASEGSRRISKLIGLCAIPILVIIIVLTQSRGAFLGLSLMGVAMFFRSGAQRIQTLSIGAISILLIMVVAPNGVMDRFSAMMNASSIDEMDPEGSAEQRWGVLRDGLQITASHPVIGVGRSMFPHEIERMSPEVGLRDAHNTYLTIAAETGLPGLLFFFLVIGDPFRASERRRSRNKGGMRQAQPDWLLYAYGSFLASSFFGTVGHISLLYIYLVYMWADRQIRQREENSLAHTATRTQVSRNCD